MKNKTIKISKDDYNFILENIAKIPYFEKNKNGYTLKISNDDIDYILDSLSDCLLEKGLYSNDEPNNLGLHIEALIDLFLENKSFTD